jgi:hypothetical protein
MRYFLDTEFIESGAGSPVDLISIGIVAEDGREFYAVSSQFNPETANDWVKDNVLPHIAGQPQQTLAEIKTGIFEFVGDDKYPQFWGYYADYDWVVFCQIFGRMIDLPKGWPMYCRDIKQLCDDQGNPKLPKQSGAEHNALEDARWNQIAYEALTDTVVVGGTKAVE